MDDILKLTLQLDQNECIRGESVFFDVTLENISRNTLQDIPDFTDSNRALLLVVESREGRRTADALTPMERDGIWPPDVPEETVNLPARGKLQLRADLLHWIGELGVGDYRVSVEYQGGLYHATSEVLALRVQLASPLKLTAPRCAAQMTHAPQTGAWIHRQDRSALLFYQQRSPNLPRNPWHGLRAAEVTELPEDVLPAVVPKHGITHGHLLTVDSGGRLQISRVEVERPKVAAPAKVKAPFTGQPLPSPISLPDGTAMVALTDSKRQQLSVLKIDAAGGATAYPLDLGNTKPIGPYACFWDCDARLHFLWAKENGREVQHGRLVLADLQAGFTVRSAHLADDPVFWLEPYVDLSAAHRGQPYLVAQIQPGQEEPAGAPPPAVLMMWCLTHRASSILCARVEVKTGSAKNEATFDTSQAGQLRVVHSVLTRDFELALLLANEKDQLFYASTAGKSLQPLADFAKKEITLAEQPVLAAAGEQASEPWVYVRYIDEKRAIEHVRLEPADQPDPVERSGDVVPSPGR